MSFLSSSRHPQNCSCVPQSSLPFPAQGMLQIWGSVHLSAPTCKLEAVAQRQRDLSGIDAPQTREKQKLLRTFGCATGLPRSQPGASLARGATRGVSPGDPCSGFSPCLRHPKKNPKPWSCRHTAMEWPRGECRYPGASHQAGSCCSPGAQLSSGRSEMLYLVCVSMELPSLLAPPPAAPTGYISTRLIST